MVVFFISGSLLISSCNEQTKGFALPEGDIEQGKSTFVRLSCNDCHSISGIEWKEGNDNLKIELGGEVTKLKSYGELVTSVINPSHKIGWHFRQNVSTESGLSKMRNYNEVMTVQELIDIVAFLQSEYKVKPPPANYSPYQY
ncbi:MAG: c-type cytochrome [Bacteroidia bacterium]|nr:c-type cytochrome [Bacteroidia bacterium]